MEHQHVYSAERELLRSKGLLRINIHIMITDIHTINEEDFDNFTIELQQNILCLVAAQN